MVLSIKVIGLESILSSLKTKQKMLPIIINEEINKTLDVGFKVATNKAHVITGRMKKNIKKESARNNQGVLSANAPYSRFENRRGSPHDFWTQAEVEIRKYFNNYSTKRIMKHLSTW